MAAKKADLEDQRTKYCDCMDRAKAAIGNGMYSAALNAAISAWDFVDGMMQYEQRFGEKRVPQIAAIEMVMEYAPLLLDMKSLDKLESLLADSKRISRNSDTKENLAKARDNIWACHRLWELLEANPGILQSDLRLRLGGEQDHWPFIIETWNRMGLVRREIDNNSYRLWLVTRMGQVVPAKCPKCGVVTEAPKAMLLTKNECPSCKATVLFIFLSKNPAIG